MAVEWTATPHVRSRSGHAGDEVSAGLMLHWVTNVARQPLTLSGARTVIT